MMNYKDLEALFEAGLGSDFFGPQSSYPYLILEADDNYISAELAHWLAELPCVVCVIFNKLQKVPDHLSYAADVVVDTPSDADFIAQNVTKFPIASLVLTQHLRLIENLDFEAALTAESFAYALLQGGVEFKNWLANRETPPETKAAQDPLLITRDAH
ncbi:MAG TPA: hypothetical protein DCP14_07655, partial [Rhodobiaceae bacterium]|nr:hypothetical protein [Rhodobiaceae bacterium]